MHVSKLCVTEISDDHRAIISCFTTPTHSSKIMSTLRTWEAVASIHANVVKAFG